MYTRPRAFWYIWSVFGRLKTRCRNVSGASGTTSPNAAVVEQRPKEGLVFLVFWQTFNRCRTRTKTVSLPAIRKRRANNKPGKSERGRRATILTNEIRANPFRAQRARVRGLRQTFGSRRRFCGPRVRRKSEKRECRERSERNGKHDGGGGGGDTRPEDTVLCTPINPPPRHARVTCCYCYYLNTHARACYKSFRVRWALRLYSIVVVRAPSREICHGFVSGRGRNDNTNNTHATNKRSDRHSDSKRGLALTFLEH